MKTINFTLALITLFQFSTWAQPVATLSDVATNFSGEFYFSEAAGFDPGSAGQNQTWDYSSLDLMFIGTDVSVPVAGSPHAAMFPTANYCYKFNGIFGGADRYYYHNLTSDKYDVLSLGYNGTDGDVYSANPRTYAVFPYTYNTVFTDSYQATTDPAAITFAATYDAYGTLILPFGTFNNVIRQKIVSNGQTNYNWYNVSPFYPILQTVLEENSLGIVKNTTVLNVEENQISKAFSAYPNPTRDIITLDCMNDISGEFEISVYDILGNTIISKKENIDNSNSVNLDLQRYPAGLYFLRITDDNSHIYYTQKIIKK